MLQMQELRAKWLEALRSGKYQQGRGAMRKQNQYCCLGVLCDVYDSSRWVEADSSECEDSYVYKMEAFNAVPPLKVLDAAGILPAVAAELIGMNDDKLASFNDIADYLEDYFKRD